MSTHAPRRHGIAPVAFAVARAVPTEPFARSARRATGAIITRRATAAGFVTAPAQPVAPAPSTVDAAVRQPLAPRAPAAVGPRPTWHHNIALASLQLIIGYQLWASGVDKLLYARFPQVVGSLLAGTLQGGHLPAPVAALMRALVLPNSMLFGFLVEWGETLAGLGLIAGAVVALVAPSVQQRLAPDYARWLALARRVVAWLALGAAAGGALMGLGFYFVDGAPSQWVMPSVAFGGVLDPGMLVLLGCLALLADAAYGWRLRRRRA